MNYSKGTLFPANDCGIFEHTIDCGSDWSSKIVVYGRTEDEATQIAERIIGELNYTGSDLTDESFTKNNDYAAAFNAWMNDYTNNPQTFEDSHTTAIRHLTEKLNGEEPSYGQLSAELFQEYLNKVSNTTREGV